MRYIYLSVLLLTTALPASSLTKEFKYPGRHRLVEVVRNHTRVKILESNNVTLRPGSVYDNITLFESYLAYRPKFVYQFIDTGLGAAEPLYPNLQMGNQKSWWQLIPAFFSKKARHIDHFTSIVTPEGCKVDSSYMLRHISEYPKDVFTKERQEGFEMVVIRFEYYTRPTPETQCGRHHANDPDPNFKPMKYMKKWAKKRKKKKKIKSLADLPQDIVSKFEAKISVIYHLDEERNKRKWAPIDYTNTAENSLWYYPEGFAEDFGFDSVHKIAGLKFLNQAKDLVVPTTGLVQEALTLDQLMPANDFNQLLEFMNGRPSADFDAETEPGNDVLYLADVTPVNYYTSGLQMIPITDVRSDVGQMSKYKLVGMTIKPSEMQRVNGVSRIVPQVRFVYQLANPQNPEETVEQLYFHLKYDAVNRFAQDGELRRQRQQLLADWDFVLGAKETSGTSYETVLLDFIHRYTNQALQSATFSSSLTGIWVFGELVNNFDGAGLVANRVVRNNVDYGFYSTSYDNDLLRAAIKEAEGERKLELETQLDNLTVTTYRDEKRNDVEKVNFHTVSCAQCHQLSARDGVHMAVNDGIDRRNTFPIRGTEYLYKESDLQLRDAAFTAFH